MNNALNDVRRVNRIEPKQLELKIIKLQEELGEFCSEIVKLKGGSYKPFNKENLIEEMADVLQCIFAVYDNVEQETGISIERDIIPMIFEKNKKWESKIQQYNKNTDTTSQIQQEQKPSGRVNLNDSMGRFNRGILMPDVISQIQSAIQKYGKNTISWGGVACTIKFTEPGHSHFDIVLFEEGVRGPADWFYYDNKGLFRHGGYTGYKDGYTLKQFLQKIDDVYKHNLKWNKKLNTVEDTTQVQIDPDEIPFVQLTSKLIVIEVPKHSTDFEVDKNLNLISYSYPKTIDVKLGEKMFTQKTMNTKQTLKFSSVKIDRLFGTVNKILKRNIKDLEELSNILNINQTTKSFENFFSLKLSDSVNSVGTMCPSHVVHLSGGNWKDGFSGTSDNSLAIEKWIEADKLRKEYLLVLIK